MYPFRKIEAKWSKKWQTSKVYEPNLDKAKKPFYNLMMFPYPSAEGLHVGNMYAFTGSDIYGRFKRMSGNDVFEPMGLDGFGIHSENYALKIGKHPAEQAKVSEKNFYKQLQMIGNGFAWNEHLETYDPEYYKWTQWLFIQMYKNGLAYRKKQAVNWCPSCKTVLADEQVEGGKCERCGTIVVKKDLEQWFFKITKYADRLLKNLDKLDWSEKIKIAQRNWIGKSTGSLIQFKISNFKFQNNIEVFTTRPDTIFGATFLAVSPELAREWISAGWSENKEVVEFINKTIKGRGDTAAEAIKEKEGIDSRLKAVNPATGEEIPIWVVNYVLPGVGTGAIMGVPAHDERDMEFAKKFNLPVSNAPLVDADVITKKVKGKRTTNYRLRDWLISRQRYWGPPIPMIYCDKCGWQPVPEKDLPVLLPKIKDFRPTGTDKSPLATHKEFYEVKCPNCKEKARRETDVSDTFLDSAWYYLRYLDPKYKNGLSNPKRIKRWLPVDMYIGGAEHAVLHLLYVRFVALALHDWGYVDFEEPFKQFRGHGLLMKDGAKMSKSKGNVINPDEYIKKFGADAIRMYLMFLSPFEDGGEWRDEGLTGITRFLERVWKMGDQVTGNKQQVTSNWIHAHIKKITEDIETLHYNTCISELMIFLNNLSEKGGTKADFNVFLKLLAPFAPFITEELWSELGNKKSIHSESWPEFNARHIMQKYFDLVIQVNGKVRAKVAAQVGLSESDARKLALKSEKIGNALSNKEVKKVIYVQNKLINFVV
ncbi:MAG: leucine--tRNA ligase [Candidatus Colwellbacteria bacterium]|nr:leucine--tRNA ligase [Candidatus Colwellbacteria bacterium]